MVPKFNFGFYSSANERTAAMTLYKYLFAILALWLISCSGHDGLSSGFNISADTRPEASTGNVEDLTTGTSGSTSDETTMEEVFCLEDEQHCELGEQQTCINNEWVSTPCEEPEQCNPQTGGCASCTCEESSCLDKDTINTCACFDLTPEPCPSDTACDKLNGETDCHPIVCNPGESECLDARGLQICNETGTGFLPRTECKAEESCEMGECLPACEAAAKNASSIGCNFWAVDMANVPPRDAYVFGVALSNPSTSTAVKIAIYDRNDNGKEQKIAEGTIPPREVKVFRLSGTSNGEKGFYPGDAGILGTGIVPGRAFRISSELPIVATQFNPLGGAKSFTTDASLLLPTPSLGMDYYLLAWERGLGAGSSMVIVATEDNTVITIRSPVDTPPGLNGMPALIAGENIVLKPLKGYDYVQVSIPGQDLSGALITSNKPVAVFGGHSCGNVPNAEIDFCDHLEEQIFPIVTWGQNYVAARAVPRNNEPMIWRVLASKDKTNLKFSPAVSIGDSFDNLEAGKFTQFTAQADFELTSDKPVLLAGYTYGCETTKLDTCPGDPSMVLVVPVEQWLSDYVFLVDDSYTNDNVKVVRNMGTKVEFGCFGMVTDWAPVTAHYESAVVNFNLAPCMPGTNTATATAPIGITVYGEAKSTSYAYPGGLALKPITPG